MSNVHKLEAEETTTYTSCLILRVVFVVSLRRMYLARDCLVET